jgi:uncharacterized membrane protein YdjX (TVP38/TMEM64 family)
MKFSKAPIIVPLLLLTGLVGSYILFPSFQHAINEAFAALTSDEQARIQTWVAQFGLWGPVVLILAMIAQMFLFVVPNVLLMMIAIISYGPIWGSIISWVGVFASSSLGYLIGSKLSQVTLDKLVSRSTQEKNTEFVNDYGVGAVMITRLSSFSNDSLSFVAGGLKMSYGKYILATQTGITPLIVLLALFGKNGKIEKALLWIAVFSMILLIGYIMLDKRRKSKRKTA